MLDVGIGTGTALLARGNDKLVRDKKLRVVGYVFIIILKKNKTKTKKKALDSNPNQQQR